MQILPLGGSDLAVGPVGAFFPSNPFLLQAKLRSFFFGELSRARELGDAVVLNVLATVHDWSVRTKSAAFWDGRSIGSLTVK